MKIYSQFELICFKVSTLFWRCIYILPRFIFNMVRVCARVRTCARACSSLCRCMFVSQLWRPKDNISVIIFRHVISLYIVSFTGLELTNQPRLTVSQFQDSFLSLHPQSWDYKNGAQHPTFLEAFFGSNSESHSYEIIMYQVSYFPRPQLFRICIIYYFQFTKKQQKQRNLVKIQNQEWNGIIISRFRNYLKQSHLSRRDAFLSTSMTRIHTSAQLQIF